MGETELGDYLGKRERDTDFTKRQGVSGSTLTDFRTFEEKALGSELVGVKQRLTGASFILGYPGVAEGGSVALAILGATGSGADAGSFGYLGDFRESWTFIGSGTI